MPWPSSVRSTRSPPSSSEDSHRPPTKASSRSPRRWRTSRRCWTDWGGTPPTWWGTPGEVTSRSTPRSASPTGSPAGCPSAPPCGAGAAGGAAECGAEMLARVPASDRDRARELDEKDDAGESTPEEDLEAFSLFSPSYFADPAAAPPVPHVEFSKPANHGLWTDLNARLPGLESSLASITVPFGVLLGELSPVSTRVGVESAARIPGGWSHVEPGAGHFVWHEAPGCLLAAVQRL